MTGTPGFLGTGWAFPPAFTPGGDAVRMVSGVEDVAQSLEILFHTHPSERPFVEAFGCDLRQFLFEEVDQRLINLLRHRIEDAVLRHEPRIVLEAVTIGTQRMAAGHLDIGLEFTLRGTNSRYNLVYPFYITEASRPAA